MRFLSEKKKVYLLLTEAILTILTLIVGVFLANKVEPDFLQTNIFYQIATFFIISFVYFNLSTINKKLCIAAILMISKMIINIIINFVLPNFTPIIIFGLFLTHLLGLVVAFLDVVFVIYFYKGLSNLASVKTKNKVLVQKWDKLLIANVVVSIYNLIIYINGLYGNSIIPVDNTAITLLLTLAVSIYTIVLGILKIVYIIKTASALEYKNK